MLQNTCKTLKIKCVLQISPFGGGKSYLASGPVGFLVPNYIFSPVRATKMNLNTFLSGHSVDIMQLGEG